MADERAAELLRAIFGKPGAVFCPTKCEPCQWGQCPGGDHPWAGADDQAHAEATGRQPYEGRCGCPCTDEPEREVEPPDNVETVSIDGVPCHLCGAAGACGYDDLGRPWIHAGWDEDETELVGSDEEDDRG